MFQSNAICQHKHMNVTYTLYNTMLHSHIIIAPLTKATQALLFDNVVCMTLCVKEIKYSTYHITPVIKYMLYLHPTSMTHMVNIFSASVLGATLPNPTDVSEVNVKYKAVMYLDWNK